MVDNNYEYNQNLFSPKGGINRLHYTLYCLLLITLVNLMPDFDNSLYLVCKLLLCILILVLLFFNVKKRIYDITFNSYISYLSSLAFLIISLFDTSNYTSLFIILVSLVLVFVKGKSDKSINM